MTLASHGNANNPEGKARRTAFRRLEEMRQLTLAGMAVRTPHPPQKATQRYPNFAFGPDDTRILIETPEKTFADMWGAAATGRTLHQLFTGYLVAGAGEIKLLRESFNPLAMAQAQLPHGAADIPPPGDEVHSF
jgi:hypothetical protein